MKFDETYYKTKRIKQFNKMMEEDYKKNLISEFQYKAIKYELNNSSDIGYKYGLFIMYLLLINK